MIKYFIPVVLALSIVGCTTVPMTQEEQNMLAGVAVEYALAKVKVNDTAGFRDTLIQVRDLVAAVDVSKEVLVPKVFEYIDASSMKPEDKAALKAVAVISINHTAIPEVPYRQQVLDNLNRAIDYKWVQ
jgi:hypothetical protein